jgi:outer membrane lipoprotein SlyB
MFKTQITKVKNNPIGTAVGAVATYWAVGKYTGISNTYARIGLAVVGGLVGANVQSTIAAKKSAPKPALK